MVVGVLAAQDGGPAGQHKELVANAFSKVVPSSINALRLGMCLSVAGFTSSKARSSVRISTTFGGFGSFLVFLRRLLRRGEAARECEAACEQQQERQDGAHPPHPDD